MIKTFKGDYRFLSIFYEGKEFIYNGLRFTNAESAFQSQKYLSQAERFQYMKPGESKKEGRKVILRSDWEEVKDGIMLEVCIAKFTQDKELGRLLKDTGTKVIIEGNMHHDNYWGDCGCSRAKCQSSRGLNMLGKALMLIRDNVLK